MTVLFGSIASPCKILTSMAHVPGFPGPIPDLVPEVGRDFLYPIILTAFHTLSLRTSP